MMNPKNGRKEPSPRPELHSDKTPEQIKANTAAIHRAHEATEIGAYEKALDHVDDILSRYGLDENGYSE